MTRTESAHVNPRVDDLVALWRSYPNSYAVPALLALLAEGQPASRERIAATIGCPIGDVNALFAGLPEAQWDDDGRLVGLGLTLVPTPHRCLIAGRTLYTWCASDTLIFTIMLGRAVCVESICPVTGREICLNVEPDRMVAVTPATAVVSADLPSFAVADIRATRCVHGRFFATSEAAQGWRAEHPDGTVLPVADEFAICQQMVSALDWAGGGGAR
ncbi:MAG: alkylmercury lyase MerB [Pseudonocardiaceae bacterium]